jgi:hypothetical protein
MKAINFMRKHLGNQFTQLSRTDHQWLANAIFRDGHLDLARVVIDLDRDKIDLVHYVFTHVVAELVRRGDEDAKESVC